jgi:Ala-tRNA(Pro) deacylase
VGRKTQRVAQPFLLPSLVNESDADRRVEGGAMISARFKSLLEESGIPFEVVTHDPAFTAQHLAARMHVPGREFVKAVVVRLDDRYAIAAVPAHRLVDRAALARAAGAGRCNLASEAEFRELFPECELGAMPPVGKLYGLATYVDEEVTRDETVVVNVGTHAEAVRLRYADLARLAQPTVGRFAVPPPSELAMPRKPRRRPAQATPGRPAPRRPVAAKAAVKPPARKKTAARKPAPKRTTARKTAGRKPARKRGARKAGGRKAVAGKRTPAKAKKKTTARRKTKRPVGKKRKQAARRKARR